MTISVSGSTEPPPATPDPVSASITEVALAFEPQEASVGDDVEILISNGSDGVVEVGPGDTTFLMTLATGDPQFPTSEPGWFRLTVRMGVTTGDYGRIDARGNLQLLQAADQVSDGGRRITSGPPVATRRRVLPSCSSRGCPTGSPAV
ncbi:MAG: hypothetical protein ACR2HR_08910 [Euzebya sp.]